jgi:uncharacterized membrane protein
MVVVAVVVVVVMVVDEVYSHQNAEKTRNEKNDKSSENVAKSKYFETAVKYQNCVHEYLLPCSSKSIVYLYVA